MELETMYTVLYILIGLLIITGIVWLVNRMLRKPTIFEKYNISDRHQITQLLHNPNTPAEDKKELQGALQFFDAINNQNSK